MPRGANTAAARRRLTCLFLPPASLCNLSSLCRTQGPPLGALEICAAAFRRCWGLMGSPTCRQSILLSSLHHLADVGECCHAWRRTCAVPCTIFCLHHDLFCTAQYPLPGALKEEILGGNTWRKERKENDGCCYRASRTLAGRQIFAVLGGLTRHRQPRASAPLYRGVEMHHLIPHFLRHLPIRLSQKPLIPREKYTITHILEVRRAGSALCL